MLSDKKLENFLIRIWQLRSVEPDKRNDEFDRLYAIAVDMDYVCVLDEFCRAMLERIGG